MTKRKFNLTPQAHKEIVTVARTLPQLVKLNPDGTQQYRKTAKYTGASDYVPGKGYTKHSQHGKEPVWVNHEVEMINKFWAHGPEGVSEYVDRVRAIEARHKEKETVVEDGGKPLDPMEHVEKDSETQVMSFEDVSKRKTFKEYLSELPDDIRQKAIAYGEKEIPGKTDWKCNERRGALSGLFTFSDTTEGHDFWWSISDKYFNSRIILRNEQSTENNNV